MSRKLFGTDGIRGVAGQPPMDARTAYALGIALGNWIHSASQPRHVMLGMDTRESGVWLAESVAAGLAARKVEARFAGVITTPGVAYLARTGEFAAGVMISASHNPFADNGLKVFDHSGFKMPDDQEVRLERDIFDWLEKGLEPERLTLLADESLDRQYVDFLVSTMQTRSRSAFGCCSAEITRAIENGASCFALSSMFSTSSPIMVSLSASFSSGSSVSRCSFSQESVNFMV